MNKPDWISDSEFENWKATIPPDEWEEYRAESAALRRRGGNGEDEPAANELDLEFARLAKLRPADYERERKGAAKRLDIRVGILDKLVAAERRMEERAGNENMRAHDSQHSMRGACSLALMYQP